MTKRTIDVAVALAFAAAVTSAGLIQAVREAASGELPCCFDIVRRAPSVANLRAYEHDLEDESVVAGALRPIMQYAQFTFLDEAGEKAVKGCDGWMFYRPSVKYLLERPPVYGKGADDPLPPIVSFRDQLAARGIRLLVVPAPNKESVYPERMTSRAGDIRFALAPQTRDLLARLQAAGVDSVDLFEVYRLAKADASREPHDALYLVQDTHWSPAGIDLAARAVAQGIVRSSAVAQGNTEYVERPAPMERIGDLIGMLQVPLIEAQAAPEHIPCRQVVRKDDGAPYRDDAASEILVLGDSFLRIFQTDEPGAAGFIAHLARELARPMASLVSDGGASTLVRQELCRRPALLRGKKLVVWEFVERDIRYGGEGWQILTLPEAEAK